MPAGPDMPIRLPALPHLKAMAALTVSTSQATTSTVLRPGRHLARGQGQLVGRRARAHGLGADVWSCSDLGFLRNLGGT